MRIRATDRAALERASLAPGDFVVASGEGATVVGEVTLRGELARSGTYPISRGERLSDVIARAGGLAVNAYPEGTVFLRKSSARQEKEAMSRSAAELEQQVVLAAGEEDFKPEAATFLRELIDQLRAATPLGRITIEADPVVLTAAPEKDVILENGDVVFVPSRPSTVLVSGQVMMPQSLHCQPGWGVDDYIEAAGGFSRYADEGYVFIVYPNGRAERVSGSSWFSGHRVIPPGSIIIIPRDLRPFQFSRFALDLTQIVSQLAITAASIATVSRD